MSSQGSSVSNKLHNFKLPNLKWQTASHPQNSTRSRKATMRSPRQQLSPPAIAAAPQSSQPINSVFRVQSSLHAVSPSSESSSPFTRGFVSEMEASCIDSLKNGLSNDEEELVENECVKMGELLSDSEKLAQNLVQKMEETVIVSSVCSAGGGGGGGGGQWNPKEAKELNLSFSSRTSSDAGMMDRNRELPLIVKDKEKGKQLEKEDEGKITSLLRKDKEAILSIKDNKLIKIGVADDKDGKKWNFRDRNSNQSSKTANAKLTAGSKDKKPKLVGKSGLGKGDKEEGEMSNFPKLPSFSLELKHEEIAADLLAITGKMPSKKPKKRTKNVQRQNDLIIPGGNLETITIGRYKVPENMRQNTLRYDIPAQKAEACKKQLVVKNKELNAIAARKLVP